ncbi:hypothetical protein FRB94_014459 [Tulasnella sp. JGI-2019a]|nr:hypothetical protein FRB94_014459 [Tulasnella sp. JGI-2019a]KAG9030911.1 hypothetical protein FRB95_003421 [Tulasnella sp. JGI-2019a]
MTTVKLWCLIVGYTQPIEVNAPPEMNMGLLKKLIVADAGVPIPVVTMTAHKVDRDRPLLELPAMSLPTRAMAALETAKQLGASETVASHFPAATHVPDQIHILVTSTALDTQGTNRRNISLDLVSAWNNRANITLPSTDRLGNYLDQPLESSEKLPLSGYNYDLLIKQPITIDACSASDLDKLFRRTETEVAEPYDRSFHFAVATPPHRAATEAGYHSFLDRVLSDPLQLLHPAGTWSRDSSYHASTKQFRPDFTFVSNNICLFRGEEKPPGSLDDPQLELAEKLTWTYDPAPYIFGYFASGPKVTLVVICRPNPNDRKRMPIVYPIFEMDLSFVRQRIDILRRLIRMSQLFGPLLSVIRTPRAADFQILERDDKTVEILAGCVKKVHNDPLRTRHLEMIYKQLDTKMVRNVDRPVLWRVDKGEVYLGPKGVNLPPKDVKELVQAVTCVLQMLEDLHQEPPIYHRDLRWPNIMQDATDSSRWFVIDWDDATHTPTKAANHLRENNHSPDVQHDDHGPEVDIWGVGQLICEGAMIFGSLPQVLQEYGRNMKENSKIVTVHEALEFVRAYASEHFATETLVGQI